MQSEHIISYAPTEEEIGAISKTGFPATEEQVHFMAKSGYTFRTVVDGTAFRVKYTSYA